MIQAQPFLGPLAADPSLRGIAGALDTTLLGVAQGGARLDQIDRPIAALADALDAQAAHRPIFFSWQQLLGGGAGPLAAPQRRLVLATPVLDYDSLMPGAPATDAVRAAAQALALDPGAWRAPCGSPARRRSPTRSSPASPIMPGWWAAR